MFKFDIELTNPCGNCYGSGKDPNLGWPLQLCSLCNGKGNLPTAFGIEILILIRDHLEDYIKGE
jgi:DnaJ-class molecular chaperone